MIHDRIAPLEEQANEIYRAIQQAEGHGFKVVLDKYNHVDLYDPASGQKTPLIMIDVLSEASE